MTTRSTTLFDRPDGYGAVSRVLHWAMAALFAVQFLSVLAHAVGGESALARALWSRHASFGLLLLAAIVLRSLWALANTGRRPPSEAGLLGLAARITHLALYALMIAVPLLAALRAYGSGRGIALFGTEIIAATGERMPELMAPANAVHGLLGWGLLLLSLGHAGMALLHAGLWRDGTMSRMVLGRTPAN